MMVGDISHIDDIMQIFKMGAAYIDIGGFVSTPRQ